MKKQDLEKLEYQRITIHEVVRFIEKDWTGKENCSDLCLQCAKCMAEQAQKFLLAYAEMIEEDLREARAEADARNDIKRNKKK